jgi:hypothetical protein
MSTEKTDPSVAEHIKRAMEQHILDAVSASEEVCGWSETFNTLKVAQKMFSEAEQKKQDGGDSTPYLNELGDEPYIEERGRYWHDGYDSFDDNDDSSLNFVSGKRGES